MRASWLRLYAPFLVLALVQGLFIAVAPSRGGGDQALSTYGAGSNQVAGGVDGGAPTGVAGGGPVGSGGPAGGSVSVGGGSSTGGAAAGGGGGGAGGGQAAAGGGAGGGAAASAGGDTSHCTEDGKQFAITRTGGPPCVAKWPDGADNGGATYRGVTAEEITVVFFSSEPNEQVNAVLRPQGLAVSEEEQMAAAEAYVEFLNARYETYGRTVKLVRVVGDCPTSPPDVDACIAAAQEVVKLNPFAVIWATSLYASVYDVWAKNGIISLGGNHFDERFFTQRRPFRYDTFMDGTQSADHIAEYYCKKMAGGKATHAGRLIHPQIGGRDTARKLGVIVPEIEANVLNAQRVAAQVEGCGGGKVAVLTYESDIERATEQTQATVSKLIAEKVTTVVCMCDPIAPAFLTKGLTANRYIPEFLMPGLGLMDYDKLGRLYDPEIMAHAFGPSHLGLNIPLDDTDQARAWRDVGREGHPCGENGCGVQWSYFALLGTGIHMAGPNLNPVTFEQGLLEALPDSGGTPESPLASFGPNDYTGLSDAKEVYWSNTAASSLDGQSGAYVPVADGKRYRLGQWPAGLDQIPVPAS
ncbi:MAG TPA: hypothetical protein VFU14_04055 [Acidimicrobiales bacterium]|nr:hypothetical protein [Acidimicrobiales bacterium]